jgi:hypothetical protein
MMGLLDGIIGLAEGEIQQQGHLSSSTSKILKASSTPAAWNTFV